MGVQVLAKMEAGKEMKGKKWGFFSWGPFSFPVPNPSEPWLLYVQEGENNVNLQAYHMHYRY